MEQNYSPAYEESVPFMPNSALFRRLVHSHPTGGWQKCWEEGVTLWDLGRTTPIIQHLVHTQALPKGKALVPGCGQGHDVIAMASEERCVVGLDFSEGAISKAKKLAASSTANQDYITFIQDNFFTWQSNDKFDLIFDYTFFCAIEPKKRQDWATRMAELLKPDGELLTLIFPISDHEDGPPYKVSVSDYEQVLSPLGFTAVLLTENEHAVESRKGYEKLGRWKRIPK